MNEKERLLHDRCKEIRQCLKLEHKVFYELNKAYYRSLTRYRYIAEYYMCCKIAPLLGEKFHFSFIDELIMGHNNHPFYGYKEKYESFVKEIDNVHIEVFGEYVDHEHILNPKQIWDNPLYIDDDEEQDKSLTGIGCLFTFKDAIEGIRRGYFDDSGLTILDFFYGVYHALLRHYRHKHIYLLLEIKDSIFLKSINNYLEIIKDNDKVKSKIYPNKYVIKDKENLKEFINQGINHYLKHKILNKKQQLKRLKSIFSSVRVEYKINLLNESNLDLDLKKY